jgi:hypothetical protein
VIGLVSSLFLILRRLRLLVERLGGVDMPKKVEEIVAALERDNPKWPKGKVWAIANATYNKMKRKKR